MPALLAALASAAVPFADHRAPLTGGETAVLLAVPVLWMLGVVVLIAHKLRSR